MSLQRWSYDGHTRLPVLTTLSPELVLLQVHIFCSVTLEAIGSALSHSIECVLRRSFVKKVYYKYYLKYMILSIPFVSYWSYHWKLEPLMNKINIEVINSFLL